MRVLFALALALCAFTFSVPEAGASSTSGMHYRASEHSGGMHYRASHAHHSRSVLVHTSPCRGPVVVTTWQPLDRRYRSGFGHFSRPSIVAPPAVFHSSRGWRGSCGGLYQGHVSARHIGHCSSYNGSVGSNNAHRRQIDWNKRARVHSPKLVITDDD